MSKKNIIRDNRQRSNNNYINQQQCFSCYQYLDKTKYIPSIFNIPIPTGIALNNNYAKVLVLACIDPRYINALEEYLLQELVNLGYSYDLFNLAGSSLGGNNEGNCNYSHWQQTFFEHIKIAVALHKISHIWIFEHLDCGAYKNCNKENDDSLLAHNLQF